jgi:hypothetical protein
MKGYFILEEAVKKIGLLENPEIKDELQKTFIVITNRDAFEYFESVTKKRISSKIFPKKIYDEIGDWFYKTYYDGLMNTITSAIKNAKNNKQNPL